MAQREDSTATALRDALIDAVSLRELLAGPGIRVLDCRHDIARPALGWEQYRQGHISGAVFAHLDHDLAGPRTPDSGRHPLPDPSALAARLRGWGIGSDTQVVAYDASEGSYAARAWWLLRWLGHERVAVLDGGWPAWTAAGFPVSTELAATTGGDFVLRPSLQGIASLEQVVALSRSAGQSAPLLLIDARAPDRYEGRNETIDPVGGHIPGAINRFWKQNLRADGRFKDSAQLQAEYRVLLGARAPSCVVVQCGSGVTACHDLLALHVAKMPGAALFPGSWSQWVSDPSRPVAVGPAP